MEERRIRRSEEPGVALGFQLEACARRAGAEFMLLADASGLLLASSACDRRESEEAAALLASLRLCDHSSGELWRDGRVVTALSFVAQGQRLIIGLAGRRLEGAPPEVEQAIGGVKRILA
jgi:hypothetical protein